MAKDLKNKIVVITGGAEGIGFEIAENFLKTGAGRVIMLDINENQGDESVKTLSKEHGDKVEYIKCDVTKDLEAVTKAVFHKYKTIDVLVNNAGILNEYDVKKTVAVNVTALIEWSFKFIDHMRIDKGGKGGTIVNIASIYGYRTDPHLPIYKASKHAVMGFTKTIGHEDNFDRFGVRVIAICPGYTYTKLANLVKLPDAKTQENFEKFLKSPKALWQTADAVGKAAVDIFNRADSGTAWLIEGGKHVEQIP